VRPILATLVMIVSLSACGGGGTDGGTGDASRAVREALAARPPTVEVPLSFCNPRTDALGRAFMRDQVAKWAGLPGVAVSPVTSGRSGLCAKLTWSAQDRMTTTPASSADDAGYVPIGAMVATRIGSPEGSSVRFDAKFVPNALGAAMIARKLVRVLPADVTDADATIHRDAGGATVADLPASVIYQ